MSKKLAWLAAAAVVVPASHAFAQPPAQPQAQAPRPAAPPAQPKRPDGSVGEVVVEGQSQGTRVEIDRRSYSVAGDLQATTGSIADALRNVPSLEVDVNGNVSLRGDSNVTIMIDGRPAGQFRGDGRGQALQALPADRIERVEVITNPSASMRADGSAGVINLVTKRARGVGRTGSMRANVGSSGRRNASGSLGYNGKQLSFSGDLSYRHDTQKVNGTDERSRLDPATGGFADSLQVTSNRADIDQVQGRAAVDYDLNPRDRLSGELRGFRGEFEGRVFDHFERETSAGALAQVFDRDSDIFQQRAGFEASTTFRRKLSGEGHELSAGLDYEYLEDDRKRVSGTTNRFPPVGGSVDLTTLEGVNREITVELDYARPLPGESKLKLGYDLDIDDNDYDNRGFRGPVTGPLAVDPNLTNLFLYDQAVHQGFATYERPIGDFTVLAGLRAEYVTLDLNQVTQAIEIETDYTRLYPSLHLSYRASDVQQFTASYSRRVQRPGPFDLNPFRVFIDPFNFRAGNPFLKPQETHSFELGWQYRKPPTFYLATLYYRESEKGFTDVVRDIGGGVFLTTRENLSKSRNGGLELVANGRFHPKVTYNVSGNVFWQEIDATQLGFSKKRDTVTLYGRANVNWQVTADDFIQLNAFVNGKRLTPQGYAKPTGMLNIGYRHKVNDKVAFVATSQNVLGTFKDRQVIDTPILKARIRRDIDVKALFVGFQWTFGGGRAREPGFEFQGGGAEAPQ